MLLLGLAADLEAPRTQVGDGRADVVAHERELVAHARVERRPFAWVHAELGGRQREDQPTMPGVDVLPPEHVAEDVADRLGL